MSGYSRKSLLTPGMPDAFIWWRDNESKQDKPVPALPRLSATDSLQCKLSTGFVK